MFVKLEAPQSQILLEKITVFIYVSITRPKY